MDITEEMKKEYGLGDFMPLQYDGYCGEPVTWGHKIHGYLGEEKFNTLRSKVSLVCISMGNWGVAVKGLTKAEAIEKYGSITHEERGPRGGFKWDQYGTTRFFSKLS